MTARRKVLFLAIFGPLVIGTGFSGFYDTLFLLAALAAQSLATTAAGGLAATVSFLLHYRGLVALSLVRWRALDRRAVALCLALVAVNLGFAAVSATHLGDFGLNNRLHFSHWYAWWFPIATAGVWWLTRAERFGPLLATTALLLFVDRQASFWHVLVVIPLAVEVLRRATARSLLVVLGWLVVSAQIFLGTWVPFPVIWLLARGG